MVSIVSLCVGKELLVGKTVNTNATWIGARLLARGGMLDRIVTVTDSLDEISWGIKTLLAGRPDFIMVIGGLGPTPDDMTLSGIAKALGRRLALDRRAVRLMEEYFVKSGRGKMEMTPARRKMAVIPAGSAPLPNGQGTAPGVRLEEAGTVIFCFPGVPREMKSIYNASVEPELVRLLGTLHAAKTVMHLASITESALTPTIADAVKNYPSAYIKSHPKGFRDGKSRIELDIVIHAPKKSDARAQTDVIEAYFLSAIARGGGEVVKTTRY